MSSINKNDLNNPEVNLVENDNSSNDTSPIPPPPPPPPDDDDNDTDNDNDNDNDNDVDNNDLNFNDDDDDEDSDGDDDGNDDNSQISIDGQSENIILSETLNNDYSTDDDDDDDDDDEDENYLQKITNNMTENMINKFHPELNNNNYDEINSFTKIYRDKKNNNIIDPFHKTIPILTKYERSRILGQRAKQINSGSKPFVEVDKNIYDGYLIALKELNEKKIPFIIRRPLPNGGSEYWKLEDLEIL